jgi:hypothetical protein
MNNKDTLDIFGQLLSGNKNMIIGKARQTGKSLVNWKKTFDRYNRAQDRKETIKRLFNI